MTGFVVAFVIGGGGGYALTPLAASGKTASTSAQLAVQAAPPRLLIEDVTGVAKVLTKGDVWRRARQGDTVERPTVILTEGPESSITVSQNGMRIIARHDARALLGTQSGSLSIQLDSGLVIVYARGNQAHVYVPMTQAVLSGEAFGVWAKPDHLVTAVLDGEVAMDTPSISSKYAKGREIMLTPKGPVPLVLASQLEIEVEKTEKAGARWKMSGKTTPNAEILARHGSRFDRAEVAPNGTFTVDLDTREPQLGDVVAYDAAGRRAEVNLPSETLDDVLNALSKGEKLVARSTPTTPVNPPVDAVEPAKKEPPAAKKEPAAAEAKPANEASAVKNSQEPERVALPDLSAEKPKPIVEKKPPEKKVGAKAEHQPRGSEPDAVKIDLPGMGHDEPAAPAEKPAKKGAKAKKGAAPKPAEEQAKPAEEKKEPEKKEPEKKDDKPVELQWE